jgi:hypothetical protein
MVRQHSHKFTIADDDAVHTLVGKLVNVRNRKYAGNNCCALSTTRRDTIRTRTRKHDSHSSTAC